MSNKVLLVDDEKELLDVVAERMRLFGLDVSTTTSPWVALKKVETEPYDAIVMDLVMPGMGGVAVLKAIKETNPDIQVILLTGHADIELCKQALKLGALDVMEKPADLRALTDKIKKAGSKMKTRKKRRKKSGS